MTQPRPAPIKPQPITHDPHAGQYQVVVSFRLNPDGPFDPEAYANRLEAVLLLEGPAGTYADIDVAIRQIGAGGEASEHEGTVGL